MTDPVLEKELKRVPLKKFETQLAPRREEYLESITDDSVSVRSLEEAEKVIAFLHKFFPLILEGFAQMPSLENLFDREFYSFKKFIEEDNLWDVILVNQFLFSANKQYPLHTFDVFDPLVLDAYLENFQYWVEEKLQAHRESQTWIEEQFDPKTSYKSLPCQCYDCLASYRTRLRAHLFDSAREKLQETIEWIEAHLEQESVAQVALKVSELYRHIDRQINLSKNKLKKMSVNKLDKQLKSLVRDRLAFGTELGAHYAQKLQKFLIDEIMNEGHDPDLVSQEEYERFFHNLGHNLFRSERFIRKEFQKFVSSILILKRRDISSTILQDYLGQFWEHSIARSLKRKIVYHMGPTNSGKTYHAIEALSQAKKGCYLAPLRLLAGELFDTLTDKGVKTSLLTGEEVIEVPDATHYSSTIEMARLQEEFDCVVIDEIQMITDKQRGWAWTRAFVNIFSPEIHICGDPSVLELIQQIIKFTGDELEIRDYQRMTDLQVMDQTLTIGSLEKGDALIVFSRRNALKYKRDLEAMGFKVSIVYGRLSPEVRREQARKFDRGETDIMVSTDAIAMGMNLPIRRIVFSTLTKHFDDKEFVISHSEIKQIAGRAGRYQRFPVGFVTCLSRVENGLKLINEALLSQLNQATQAMVGPDLDIFNSVNQALEENNLKHLKLSEFLRLFNTMSFRKPFYCVELNEMIELAEMVEEANYKNVLSSSEIFGFACAPVNLGMNQHVEYYVWILNNFVACNPIQNEEIEFQSDDIDYLETSIKCVELYQWLSRHFNNKNFSFQEEKLLDNKQQAIEQLNNLLSKKLVRYCSSCGVKLADSHDYNICEGCFKARRFGRRRPSTKKKPENGKNKRGTSRHKKRSSDQQRRGRSRSNGNKKRA